MLSTIKFFVEIRIESATHWEDELSANAEEVFFVDLVAFDLGRIHVDVLRFLRLWQSHRLAPLRLQVGDLHGLLLLVFEACIGQLVDARDTAERRLRKCLSLLLSRYARQVETQLLLVEGQ